MKNNREKTRAEMIAELQKAHDNARTAMEQWRITWEIQKLISAMR